LEAVRRRDDDELCGFVEACDGTWAARVVFGSEIGRHERREDAIAQVLAEGLGCLAERWTLRGGGLDEDEIVCILEANDQAVTVSIGYYSMPGSPRLTITTGQLTSGEWVLER